VTLLQHHDAILGPLIRQEVIKVESSSFGHSSFTTVENFFSGHIYATRNVKTMGNRGLHSY